jgi:hypothetical protein
VSQVTRTAPWAPSAGVPSPGPRRRSLGNVLAAWSPALFGAAFFLQAVRAGSPAESLGRALLAVAATQVLPGVLIWRTVRPLRGWWLEDLAVGFALGTVVAVAAQMLAGLARIPALAGGLGLVVAAFLLSVPGTRRRVTEAQTTPLPRWWAPGVSLTSLVGVAQLQSYYHLVPLNWPSGFRSPHVDTYFHLSMAAELAHRGPLRFPWVASEPLVYHWFSHAWIAQVSVASGAGLDEVLMRFTPALIPLVVTFTIAAAAIRLSGRAWTGPGLTQVAELLGVALGIALLAAAVGRDSMVVNYWKPDLLALNDGFIEHPDGSAMRRLRALGVRWVFVDHTRPHAATLAPWAIPRLRNPGVDVYEIPPAR